ncbi:hypothetical protein B9G53_12185 [Pseudanabaena sp. SR411]|uniref:NUDIX domain-containing protein n=1 Tax=Pseudanabaena sp. SR411 TaxID=1980935 RepID=UPI000B99922A|nr:NUDIX hydrolase [Pseudanabaena sp. SR411]OYQ64354.1 hypothetical protein B9G53_12185 [Pseudanabaena sp. SR411]
MTSSHKRRRGTAIVETEAGIILAETSKGLLILPGGGTERGESRFAAAIRELQEETGLKATSAIALFDYESSQNYHKVVWIMAEGNPEPKDDAIALHYCQQGQVTRFGNLSNATLHILHQFWDYRSKNEDLFKMLQKY